MNDEIRDAYADGFNQTADLRFVEREVAALDYGPNVVKTVRILQQRYVRRVPGYGSPIEQDRWIDVPLVTT